MHEMQQVIIYFKKLQQSSIFIIYFESLKKYLQMYRSSFQCKGFIGKCSKDNEKLKLYERKQ